MYLWQNNVCEGQKGVTVQMRYKVKNKRYKVSIKNKYSISQKCGHTHYYE